MNPQARRRTSLLQWPLIHSPLKASPCSKGESLLDKPNVSWLKVMARLAPGVGEAGARAALKVFTEQLRIEPGRVGRWVSGIRGFASSPVQVGSMSCARRYGEAPLHGSRPISGHFRIVNIH